VPACPPRRAIPNQVDRVTPLNLVADRLLEAVSDGPGWVVGAAGRALGLLGRALADPVGTAERAVDYGQSLRRMPHPAGGPAVPAAARRRVRLSVTVHDVSLDELKAAGKAAGGSVNDAFLAGVLGRVPPLPHGLRVAVGPDADGHPDQPARLQRSDGRQPVHRRPVRRPGRRTRPVARIQLVREFILNVRAEPAIAFLDLLTPVLSKLPSPLLTELTAELTKVSDVQASNIPGLGHPVYLAGAKVLRMYPIGPRPGVAAMVTMVSYDGVCCIGVNVDPRRSPTWSCSRPAYTTLQRGPRPNR